VLHGNWTPTSIKWRTSTVVRPDQPEQQFPQINLQIVVEHDFIDGVHKILLTLTVIGLVSWGLLWLNFVQFPASSSLCIGGTITLMLTPIGWRFVLERELAVVHYLTLSVLLCNGTISMLGFSVITSCFIAGLISMQNPHGALAFVRQMLYESP